MADNTTVVTRVEDRDRYEITADDQPVGFTAYIDHNGQRIFYHTEIGEGFGGRGLGSTLLRQALADTREAGLRVVPVCSFVEKYLESHHEIDDVVDAVTSDALTMVRERAG